MKTLLYGLRASGKTSILGRIQEKTGTSGLDLDKLVVQEIQETHTRIRSISEFVEGIGSMRQFRDIEHYTLENVMKNNSPCLVALGGGTIAYDRNRHIIDPVDNYMLSPHSHKEVTQGVLERVFNRVKYPKKTLRIFLDISPEEQVRRLEKDDEGNKDRPDLGKDLQGIYDERIDNYRNFADISIEVNGKTIEIIVDEILGYPQIQEAIKEAA